MNMFNEVAWLFAQSALIGISIAAPVGPIGLLVIQRTLQRGALVGLSTGLGAALADAVYGAVGAYGVSGLIHWLQGMKLPLAVVGGAVLLWMAWRTWQAPVARESAVVADARGLLAAFAGTFVLTLSNPATILSFIAIFGSFASRAAVNAPAVMVAGVLIGSALWWLLLSAGVSRLRARFDEQWQRRVNRCSAAVLAVFALWPLLALWMER